MSDFDASQSDLASPAHRIAETVPPVHATLMTGRTTSSDIRLRLVLAAERLFAVRGFGSTSIRDINAAANVTNTSAIYYHFGSREGLIAAILEFRAAAINPQRMDMISTLKVADAGDVRSWVSALVLPISRWLLSQTEGSFYVRFVQRLSLEGPARQPSEAHLISGWLAVDRALLAILDLQDPEVAKIRLRMTKEMMFAALAGIERSSPPPEEARIHVDLLIDGLTAMLMAPVHGLRTTPLKHDGSIDPRRP